MVRVFTITLRLLSNPTPNPQIPIVGRLLLSLGVEPRTAPHGHQKHHANVMRPAATSRTLLAPPPVNTHPSSQNSRLTRISQHLPPHNTMSEATDTNSSNVAAPTRSERRGARLFKKHCATCHTTEEGKPHGTGPNLSGVWGRLAGTTKGFDRYSPAMKNSGVTWTEETLFPFLEKPRRYVHGCRMAFAGLRDEKQRKDLIAHLRATCKPENNAND